jgi:hypothetical protein
MTAGYPAAVRAGRSVSARGYGTSDSGAHGPGHSLALRCWTPRPVPLSRLIVIAVTRWRIEDHLLAKHSTGLDAGQVIRWTSWHHWTAICLLSFAYLAVAVAVQRLHDADADLDAGLIPVTVGNCCGCWAPRLCRRPGETVPTGRTCRPGDVDTSTEPARPASGGTPTPRPHHDHRFSRPHHSPCGP